MSNDYLFTGDPTLPERHAWLNEFHGCIVFWEKLMQVEPVSQRRHRIFTWRPGEPFVRVYDEFDHGAVFDNWLLDAEAAPHNLRHVEAKIAERRNSGY